MTEKQKQLMYYKIQGYSNRHCELIAQVSRAYAHRILSTIDDSDLDSWIGNYTPPLECVIRRKILDHIVETAGLPYVPRYQRYNYISLLGYLGFTFKQLSVMFAEDQPEFIYNAIHRSNKAWKNLDPEYIGVSQEDYDNLLRIRRKN